MTTNNKKQFVAKYQHVRMLMVLVLAIVSCNIDMRGQQKNNPKQGDKPIYLDIYFKSGIERENGSGKIKNVAPNIRSILAKYKLNDDAIKIRDEKFSPKDTVGYNSFGTKVKRINKTNLYTLELNADIASSMEKDLKSNENVFLIAKRQTPVPTYTPNDPWFNWTSTPYIGYPFTAPQAYLYEIQAPQAWDIYKGDPNNNIAVFDPEPLWSGHPDLYSKVIYADYATATSFSHGTLVAGIAAAMTDNNYGIAGIDHQAKLVGYSSSFSPWSNILYNPNIVVSNHSYFTNIFPGYNEFERADIIDLYNYNKVTVFTSGNWRHQGWAPIAPGYYGDGKGVIVVGYTNKSGGVHSNSQIGPHIDIVAPGEGIVSTSTDVPADYRSDQFFAGTGASSMAAPQVAGVSSLLIGYAKNIKGITLTNDDVENIIKVSATKVSGTSDNSIGRNDYVGHGKLNAFQALHALQNGQIAHLQASNNPSVGQYVANTLTSPIFQAKVIGCLGISDGTYSVQRYEVQVAVPLPFYGKVWGNGAMTSYGYAPEETDPSGEKYIYGMGFAEPVPGTVSASAVLMRTFVYRVVGTNQWFPCQPADILIGLTVFSTPYNSLSNTIENHDDVLHLTALGQSQETMSISKCLLHDLSIYPMPITENTNIKYTLEEDAEVTISIADIATGQKMQECKMQQQRGNHLIPWQLSISQTGSYLLTLESASTKRKEKVSRVVILQK